MSTVTEEELERAVDVMLKYEEAASILNRTRWWVHLAGPYFEKGADERCGVHLHIRLEEPLWVEGVFWLGGGAYKFNISAWTEAIDALVDFKTDKLAVLMPGSGRPAKKVEIDDPTLRPQRMLPRNTR